MSANWLLIGVLVVFLFFMIYGWSRGAIRILFNLVEVVVLIIIIGLLVRNVAAFIGIFIVAVVVLLFVSVALKLFSRLPVIRTFNRVCGLLVGILLALTVIWLFFWIMSILSFTTVGQWVISEVSRSQFLTWIYQHNEVMRFASEHFTWYGA